VEQAIIVAFVRAAAKLYRVVILVEMPAVEVEEVGLLADLEMVVREAPWVEPAATAISVEMVKYLVEMELYEPKISCINGLKYLRNDTPPSRTWISHNTRLSTSNSAHSSHELSK
jgi:hypothetical protein